MSTAKVIKRYANRKLYDTDRSGYVTLEDIASMIKSGEEIRVVDNKTGEDLTSVTLAQIIFEAEKKSNFMPLGLLRNLVQNSGEAIGEFARGRVDRVSAAVHDIKETAQKLKHDLDGRLDRVISRKQGDENTAAEAGKSPQKIISDLVIHSQKTLDDLQKSIEDKVKGSVGTVSRYATLGRDMSDIRERLAALEERLNKLQ